MYIYVCIYIHEYKYIMYMMMCIYVCVYINEYKYIIYMKCILMWIYDMCVCVYIYANKKIEYNTKYDQWKVINGKLLIGASLKNNRSINITKIKAENTKRRYYVIASLGTPRDRFYFREYLLHATMPRLANTATNKSRVRQSIGILKEVVR